MIRLGVDLGGTKIEIIALGEGSHITQRAGEILFRHRVPTPQGDYLATLQAIKQLVDQAIAQTRQRVGAGDTVFSLGIGIPGAESANSGLIQNANSTCLIGQPLRADLQFLLQRDVRLANDANCFALSEATDGAAAGEAVVFGVILGTGVGGGIVVNGAVLEGANRIAGEWGHNPLSGESSILEDACYCGRLGCIEQYLSGPGLLADYLRNSVACGTQKTSVEAIVAGAKNGDPKCDPECDAALSRYEARLSRALANVINILDPACIVLGGGLSNIERLYNTLPLLWAKHVFSNTVATRLVKHQHGDSSGVRGAAWLW